MAEILNENEYIVYKDKPFLRKGNEFCYGDMDDKYILQLLVFNTKKVKAGENEVEVPDNVVVNVLSTDTSKSDSDRLYKSVFASGLYDAMDIGLYWLGEAIKESK